ncbi:MAG: tape measure protein [Pseudomonas sp.]
MTTKDVQLRIRAKDAASANVKKISDALKLLSSDVTDAAKGSNKLGDSLGGLTTDVAKLQRGMDRIKAVGQIAVEFDKTSSSVARLETSVRGTTAELAKIARESEAATKASSRYQGQLASEQSALAGNKTALAAARKEQSELTKLVREAEAAQKSLNAVRSQRAGGNVASAGVGTQSGAPTSSARTSMGAFVASDLEKNRASQARVNAEIKNYERVIQGSTAAIKELRPQAAEASAQQTRFAAETDKTAASLRRQRDALTGQRAELTTIDTAVRTASVAMGGMVVSQEAVSQSAERMAANLAKAKAQIAALSESKAPVAAGENLNGSAKENAARREAVERLRELRRELVGAQADAQRLNAGMRSTTQPTEAMGTAVGRAQQTVRNLKAELTDLTGRLRTSGGGFKEFEQRVAEIQSGAVRASGSVNQLASSTERAGSSQRQLSPQIRTTANSLGDAATKTNTFNASLLGLGNGTAKSVSIMQRLRGEILSLTAGYLGFQAAISNIGGALAAYQKLEATQSRLGAVFKQDTAAVAREIDFLRAQSDRLGISFGTLAEEYGKFTVAADSANFTVADTRKIFLSVAEAGRVNKLSMEQMSGVFLALTQMISKGKVSSEELRRQLGDRMTGAFNIFADAIGVTTAQLDEMMKKGEVIADRSTLLKFADELSKRFGPQLSSSLDTVTADLGRFENSVFDAQLAMSQGFIPGLRDALQSFNEFSKSNEGRLFFTELGVTIGKFISILAEVPKYFDVITTAIQAFIAVKIGGFLLETVRKISGLRTSMMSLSQSMAFVGPQMKQMGVAQRILGQGFAQVVGRVDSYRTSLLQSTAATGATRLQTLAFAGTRGVFRTALVVTAGAARALWAAFGGLPGLIAVGITLAVGSWLTGVDNATTALTEHERQIEAVKTAYHEAGGELKGWAETIKGALPVALAEDDLKAQVALYDKSFGQIADSANNLKSVFADFKNGSPNGSGIFGQAGSAAEIEMLLDAVDKLGKRQYTVEEFNTIINDLQQSTSNTKTKEWALELLKAANAADDSGTSLATLSKRIDVAAEKLKIAKGEISDTAAETFNLVDGADGVAKALDHTAEITAYGEAIDTLKSKIPSLTAELKKLKDMTEINKAAWTGMTAAFQAGDYGKIVQIVGLWAQAAGAVTDQANAAMMSNYPGAGKDITERIIYIEGGQKGGGPSTSSARGIGQFTESTWLGMFDKIYPELAQLNDTQKLALRTNEEAARKMLDALTQQNQAALVGKGLNPTPGNTYLAHFLGANDAIKVLLANPDELAANIVQKQSVDANPTVFKPGMTAGDLQGWANDKMGGGSPIQSTGQTKQEETNQDIQLRIDALKEEATARQESNREGEIAKEISRAQNQATKDGTTLTEEQIAALRDATGAKYDSLHAGDELVSQQQAANIASQEAQALAAQRTILEKEFKDAQASGDQGAALGFETQLTTVNERLTESIAKARAMWEAIGGPAADVALTKLDSLALKTSGTSQKMGMLGLSMQQWGGLAGSFADGMVGMFDNFAKAIANGSNAIQELGIAFMQFAATFMREIAMMILKQMVLNALQAFFPGLPIGHTGGVVGTKAIGGGNGRIGSSQPWVQNALTYHTGGVAGLKPDEVNATLRVGEEILTEEDPRHRNNATAEATGGGAASQQSLKQVLVLDPKELSSAMSSKHGEQVIMTVIKSNRSTLRQMLG